MIRFLVSLFALVFAAHAFAAPKVALVVAVGQYRAVATLANPPRDAQLVGAALRAAGFAVTPLVDPDRGALVAALAAFRQRAVGAEAAIIYFAGHGVEVEGANLLLPIDVLAGSPDEVKLSAINARQLASAVGPATRLRLVVLDACRDNPFAAAPGATRSLGTSRGLAREAISGVVTLLATQAGQRAEDRSKLSPANSPFARAFAEVVGQAGLEVVRLPTRLARAMAAGDGIAQQPDQIGIWLDDEYRLQPVLASVADAKPPTVVAQIDTAANVQDARPDQTQVGSYPTRGLHRDAIAACSGFSTENYRERALADGPDKTVRTMCGRAFELYSFYLNAVRMGYSETDANRTYAGHQQAAQEAIAFLPQMRSETVSAAGSGRMSVGLTLQPLTRALRKQLSVPETVVGVVIADVVPASDAARKGIQRGDVILKIGDYLVATPADAAIAVDKERRAGRDMLLMLVQRGAAAAQFLEVSLSAL